MKSTTISRYELREPLAVGGMGVVYRAWDPVAKCDVALKTIRAAGSAGAGELSGFAERFKREAALLHSLSHPNIVAVLDTGEHEGMPFLVMELLRGDDLGHLLARRGRLAPADLLEILRAVADALDYAHQHGVVHRDVKPDNIFVTDDGLVKLMDFGIARNWQAAAPGDVSDEAVKPTRGVRQDASGAVAYMSPEQIMAKGTDFRSDVFSMAVTAYELVSGTLPFEGSGESSTAFRVVYDDPVPLSPALTDVPESWRAALARGLAKDPEDRWPSCRAFVQALESAYGVGGDAGMADSGDGSSDEQAADMADSGVAVQRRRAITRRRPTGSDRRSLASARHKRLLWWLLVRVRRFGRAARTLGVGLVWRVRRRLRRVKGIGR